MSKGKKILAVLLTVIMTVAMVVTAFAAGTEQTATITINDAGNAKFGMVQVIQPDSSQDTGWDFVDGYADEFLTAFGYSEDSATNRQTIIKGMIYAENPTATEGKVIEGFASKYAAALAAVFATISDNVCTLTAPLTVTGLNSAGVHVIKGVEKEYSFSPMAAYIGFDYPSGQPSGILDDVIAHAKKAPTTIEKVNNDNDKVVEIGRRVTYTVTGTVPFIPETDTNKSYIAKDQINGARYNVEQAEGTNKGKLKVNVKVGTTYDKDFYVEINNNSFTLNLTALVTNNSYANQTITISYSAIVTDKLVNNEIQLGDGSNEGKFGKDSDKLITGEVKLTKKNTENVTLLGAEFVVLKTENSTSMYATFDNDKKLTGWVTDITKATKLTTDSNGTFTVFGLDKAIVYELKEVKAPDGYSINETNVTVTWGEIPTNLNETVKGTTEMTDTKLANLPSTGGIGTTIFTAAGCLIMICAAVFLFASRRRFSK